MSTDHTNAIVQLASTVAREFNGLTQAQASAFALAVPTGLYAAVAGLAALSDDGGSSTSGKSASRPKATAKKAAPLKKTTARKTTARKTTAKKAPARKTSAKKTSARKR
jgi:hypothetical protein